jgi:acetyl-CoA carboxylase biotin carboxyl carrier protein
MARGLAEIVSEHGLAELIVDTKDVTLTVRRGGVVTTAPAMAMPMAMPVPMPAVGSGAHAAAPTAAAAPAAPEDKAHAVTSPFVGTFYRKPNPDSQNYVSLNEKVEKGQVLCIVEAMKLMNEIEADVAGTIVAILVEDGSPVEYGQPLFKIA